MKVWHSIRKFILRYEYMGFGEDVYTINHGQIDVMNQKVITTAGVVAFFLMVALYLLSFISGTFSKLSLFYLLLMIAIAIMLSVNKYIIVKKKNCGTLTVMYLMMIFAYLDTIAIGVFGQEGNATSFCVLVTVMPIFIIDNPIRIDLVNIAADIVFIALSIMFKDKTIAYHDAINATIFTLCSFGVSYYNVKTKLSIIVANRKLK